MYADIVIIDSGIDQNNGDLMQYCKNTIHINDSMNIDNQVMDSNGHGTAILDLYRRLCPKNSTVMIKAFENECIDEEKLICALQYVLENVECKILSLSGGLVYCNDIDRFEAICKKISKRGTIIVAAFDNTGTLTLPAAFPEVVGVDWSPNIFNSTDFEYFENSVINIRGGAISHKLCWKDGETRVVSGSSFVVPYVVKNILQTEVAFENNDFEDILKILRSISKKEIKLRKTSPPKSFPRIQKAICIPFNKEIEVMARNIDMLNFKVEGFYDFKYGMKLGKTTNDILGVENTINYTIKSISEINWENDFDTVILGHVDQIIQIVGTREFDEILQKCLKYKKNVYSLDGNLFEDAVIKKFETERLLLYYPKIDKSDFPNEWYGKMYLPSCPSIGVFGTSSKQGKFSLLLKLMSEFKRLGYNTGTLGTEPTSLLYGMDAMYPCGYNSHNELKEHESIATINNLLYKIELSKPDVVLFSSQSNTISPESRCLRNIPTYQQSFLYAIRPDVCILCVHSYDDIEYVKNTIKYIESIGNSFVLGIVISPVITNYRLGVYGEETFSNDMEESQIKEKFSVLDRNIYMFTDSGVREICSDCIRYFTS